MDRVTMEQTAEGEEKITKKLLTTASDPKKLLFLTVLISLVLGSLTGYILASKATVKTATVSTPKTAQQDTRTFRDFAEGVIKAKPQPSDPGEYVEGTHLLEREKAVPVALTSSVVDLALYENKKVKVFGETQKALREGWLMDVGKVEELK